MTPPLPPPDSKPFCISSEIGGSTTFAFYTATGDVQGTFNGLDPDPGETIIMWEYTREHWVEVDRKP